VAIREPIERFNPFVVNRLAGVGIGVTVLTECGHFAKMNRITTLALDDLVVRPSGDGSDMLAKLHGLDRQMVRLHTTTEAACGEALGANAIGISLQRYFTHRLVRWETVNK
jgi:hypothetical protein